MQNVEKVSCELCDGSAQLEEFGFAVAPCPDCNPSATVKPDLTVEPVSNRYKFKDGECHLCWACGALPIDGGLQAWEKLPWIVTLSESGGWRFLIDSRDPNNPDMFSGFKINAHGSIGKGITLTTGSGGRINLHRSHFMEDLPA